MIVFYSLSLKVFTATFARTIIYLQHFRHHNCSATYDANKIENNAETLNTNIDTYKRKNTK